MADPNSIQYFEPISILIVEDNEIDHKVLEAMLSEAPPLISRLKTVSSLASAIKSLSSDQFDVVVLDLNLPDSRGQDTLKQLNKMYPDVAIVVNTGAYEDELGVKTLGFGAQDFLVKGKYSTYILNKTLRYAIERKRLEIELKQAYHKLKETQAELIQVEKMKVVGSLASGIAHEVKNPLAIILFGITYLSEQIKPKNKEVQLVFENIKEAIDRANNIISDLLNFSKINHLNKRKEDLNEVIEKSIMLVKHEAERSNVHINKNLDPNLPEVEIDRNRIEQVFINLFLNAIQAMPRGGTIKLKTYSHQIQKNTGEMSWIHDNGFKVGQRIVIACIEDQGCGIATEKINKVFDPFFTTRPTEGGVGLGLSVSKNIIDIHEGHIAIENQRKGGVRVSLAFKT